MKKNEREREVTTSQPDRIDMFAPMSSMMWKSFGIALCVSAYVQAVGRALCHLACACPWHIVHAGVRGWKRTITDYFQTAVVLDELLSLSGVTHRPVVAHTPPLGMHHVARVCRVPAAKKNNVDLWTPSRLAERHAAVSRERERNEKKGEMPTSNAVTMDREFAGCPSKLFAMGLLVEKRRVLSACPRISEVVHQSRTCQCAQWPPATARHALGHIDVKLLHFALRPRAGTPSDLDNVLLTSTGRQTFVFFA